MGCILKGGGGLYPRLVVGAVLLAAGEARRLGGRPKSLLELGGVPLIRRNLFALSGAGVDEVAVVLGHRADEVEPVLLDFPVTLVRNPDYSGGGQMSSVRVGLGALTPKLDAVIIALADQPLINAQDIVALISAYKKRGSASAVVPYVEGERGNPIIIDATVRDSVLAGDVNFGCRQWLAAHPDQVLRLETDNRHYRVDVDSPQDIAEFATRYGHALRWPADIAACATQ